MNFVIIDGLVGKVERVNSVVHVRLCHKDSWVDKATNDWKHEDTWVTVDFFGKRADAAEQFINVGEAMAVECAITVFPKEGPGSAMRLKGLSFHLLQKRGDRTVERPFYGEVR